jgi:hypothetical protein
LPSVSAVCFSGYRGADPAHFDNSVGNKFNPDPNKTIHWGDRNWDEMQNCFVGVLIDPKIDGARLFSPSASHSARREAPRGRRCVR